ncbi:MAG TPA: hypothetical protein VGI81_19615 [Tepidisphaeraceae bacterium]|jgi:hypothetical protein
MSGLLPRRAALAIVLLAIMLCYAAFARAAEPQATAPFAGQFTSDAITLRLAPGADGSYTGEIHFKSHTYPAHATASAGQLRGAFDSDGDSFPFTASFDGGVLRFATGGATYRLQRGGVSDNSKVAMSDFTLRDEEPTIQADAIHLRVPEGWWVKGRVLWAPTALSPARILLCTGDPNGPELWAAYPNQSFVWRDNFNLFGLSFPLKLGDADPMTGEEIERPLPSAADCIRQVIVPRYRKDLTEAKVVSSKEYSPDQAARLEKSILGQPADAASLPGVALVHRAAIIRVAYRAGDRPVQEDLFCLALYADMPTRNLATLHLWQIEFATSFRADAGKLDDETRAVADPIRSSFRIDPQWMTKVTEMQKKIGQAYAQRLNELAQAVQAEIRRQLNQSIFDMTQRSYHRRQEIQAQQFHQMDNVIVGQDDYVTPNGQKIQAPLAPMGKSAWLGSDGKSYYFNSSTNPNDDARRTMTYQSMKPQQ